MKSTKAPPRNPQTFDSDVPKRRHIQKAVNIVCGMGVMTMKNILIYPAGSTPACAAAARALEARGIGITDHVTPEATHLLLDVPSFASPGVLRGGGDFGALLAKFSEGIGIIGGNLPELPGHPVMDLLQDDGYQFQNAALTAECALQVAAQRLDRAFRGMPVLILGWGRIGKHLAFLLRSYGARVSILSRSARHRAEAESFGLLSLAPEESGRRAGSYPLVFNTAPGPVLPQEVDIGQCLKIDLASQPGLFGEDVVYARGLPGLRVPGSAGALMAETILRRWEEERE